MSILDSLSSLELAVVVGVSTVVLLIAGSIAWRLPTSVLLGVAMIAAVFQGFVPYGYISLSLLLTLAMGPAALHRARRKDFGLWFWLVVAIGVVQGASILWSPTLGAVLHAGASTAVLLVLYLLWMSHLRDAKSIVTPLRIAAPAVLLFSLVVIVFRFAPTLEQLYLHNAIARFFSEPGVDLIPSGRYPNVIDPNKAGAFMLNGNAAALMLALAAVLFGWGALSARGRTRYALGGTAAIAVAALVATGSKSPVYLALLIFVVIAIILVARRSIILATVVGAVLCAVIATAFWLAGTVGSSLVEQSVDTVFGRGKYWEIAALEFPRHWLLGLGYGGWESAMQEHWTLLWGENSAYQGYPAHNFVLQAWSDGGVVLASLIVVTSILPIAWAGRGLYHAPGSWRATSTSMKALLFAGTAWPVIHSLTDTTTFFGENHTLPLYAAIVALAASTRKAETSLFTEVSRPGPMREARSSRERDLTNER